MRCLSVFTLQCTTPSSRYKSGLHSSHATNTDVPWTVPPYHYRLLSPSVSLASIESTSARREVSTWRQARDHAAEGESESKAKKGRLSSFGLQHAAECTRDYPARTADAHREAKAGVADRRGEALAQPAHSVDQHASVKTPCRKPSSSSRLTDGSIVGAASRSVATDAQSSRPGGSADVPNGA